MRRLIRILGTAVVLAWSLAQLALAERVTVLAAASLKDALDAVAGEYEARTPHEVVIAYAGSSALARQVQAGVPADLILLANPQWMDVLARDDLLVPDSRQDLLGNRLALVSASAGPAVEITPALDLSARLGGGRLAMALVQAVPAGIYGKAALETLSLWPSVADRVAQTDNVRAALALVASGAAPLGVVYVTDALAEPRVHLLGVFPETSHPKILYPVARLRGAGPVAADFQSFLFGEAAQGIFAEAGFLPLTR